MFGRRKKQQPERDPLLEFLMALVGDRGDGTFDGRVLGKALHDAKKGQTVQFRAGPTAGFDCDAIADQVGQLELTGRGFVMIHDALAMLHATQKSQLCEDCHQTVHELIDITESTVNDMVKTATGGKR